MGLKDFFAKQTVPDKEPVLRDRSTILAYLEELSRLRTEVQVWINKDDLRPAAARVELVSDESETFTLCLQRALPGELDPRFPLEMLFPLEGMRFRCPIRFRDRSGYMKALFKVPECVYHAERREKLRTRFGQRENASVTVLESLFEGRGTSGKLLNLSMEGLCMRLEKAISIQENKRLAITNSLFNPRQPLMMVRILDLPHAPLVECGGVVMHLEDGPEGLIMGIQLEGLGGLELQTLRQVMTRRVPTFARGFPQKRRRCEMDLEPTQESPLEDTPEQTAEALPIEPAPEETASPGDGLMRLRKRSRRLLIIELEDLDRAILAGTLLADGFNHVQEARNFSEAFQSVKANPLDLIILEQNLGAVPVQQFLTQLRKLGHCEDVPVILLTDHPDVKTIIMAKAMHIAYLQKQPIDYDGELRNVLYGLLKIA